MATQGKSLLDLLVESLPAEPRQRVGSQRNETPAKKRPPRRFQRRKLTFKKRTKSVPEVKSESESEPPAPADHEVQKSEEEESSDESTTPPKRSGRRSPPKLPVFDDSNDEDYEDEPVKRKKSKKFVYDSEGAIHDILTVSASSDSDMEEPASDQKPMKRKRSDTTM
jgi:hypothetical protein